MTTTSNRAHAHVQPENLASWGAQRPETGPDSARRPARARVIPHLKVVDQEFEQEQAEKARAALGAELLAEMAAETARMAADSDFAEQHMTPADAFSEIFPEKGEARRNPLVWTAMSLAGFARFLIVSLGHMIALSGATRIRAGVITTVLVLALVASWVATIATP